MALRINGQVHADGQPLRINLTQAGQVRVNTVIAWKNTEGIILPQFTDLGGAGNDLAVWLEANYPEVTSVQLINNLTQPTLATGDFGTKTVELVNNGEIQGSVPSYIALMVQSPMKLTNNGWIRGAGGNGGVGGIGGVGGNGGLGGTGGKGADVAGGSDDQIFTASGTFTPSAGVTSVTLCMIGGGGGGRYELGNNVGGGYSGIVYNSAGVAPGPYTVTIGTGGAGGSEGIGENGSAGTPTSYGGISAAGGAGGTNTGFVGNGEARSGCWGTSYNGVYQPSGLDVIAGGQAGFGNGGAGSASGGGGTGGVGAGGGGSKAQGGVGGRGECRVSWTASTLVGGAGGAGGAGGTTLGTGGIGGIAGVGKSYSTTATVGGVGGTGAAGGLGVGGTGGNPSSPAGGYSGGTGGTGGARGNGGLGGSGGGGGTWGGAGGVGLTGIIGNTGITGGTGSVGAGGGSAGLVGAGGSVGYAGVAGSAGGLAGGGITGFANLTGDSVTGNVDGTIT